MAGQTRLTASSARTFLHGCSAPAQVASLWLQLAPLDIGGLTTIDSARHYPPVAGRLIANELQGVPLKTGAFEFTSAARRASLWPVGTRFGQDRQALCAQPAEAEPGDGSGRGSDLGVTTLSQVRRNSPRTQSDQDVPYRTIAAGQGLRSSRSRMHSDTPGPPAPTSQAEYAGSIPVIGSTLTSSDAVDRRE